MSSRKIIYFQVINNDSRRAPYVITPLLILCVLFAVVNIGPGLYAAAKGAPGTVMCTTFDGTFNSIFGAVVLAVSTHCIGVIRKVIL